MKKQKCNSEEPNHSEDVWEVWHGTPMPLYLCGFHWHKRQALKRYQNVTK
jgi:hypothetical protein